MSITIGIGKNLKVTSIPTPSANEPEVDVYISGLATALSVEQITRLNNLVYSLKNGLSISALSEIFDVLYIFAGETQESSLRNLIRRSNDATTVNAPTFTIYEGFTGDGISKYLNSNYNEISDGINFNLATYNYMIGSYCRSGSYGSYAMIGARNTPGDYHQLYNRNLAQLYYYGHAAVASLNYNNTAYPRLASAGRNSDVNNVTAYLKNKTESGNQSNNKVFQNGMNFDYFILACNNQGAGATVPFDGQLSMVFISRFLSMAENNTLWDSFLAYMNANGKDL